MVPFFLVAIQHSQVALTLQRVLVVGSKFGDLGSKHLLQKRLGLIVFVLVYIDYGQVLLAAQRVGVVCPEPAGTAGDDLLEKHFGPTVLALFQVHIR